jgi:hypothetical protein
MQRSAEASKLVEHQPLKTAVVSGPYTLDDSLEYEPFEQFMQDMHKAQPDVIILVCFLLTTCPKEYADESMFL